jgi:hypothetical protein
VGAGASCYFGHTTCSKPKDLAGALRMGEAPNAVCRDATARLAAAWPSWRIACTWQLKATEYRA